MKKYISIIVCAFLLLLLVGCNNKNSGYEESSINISSEATTTIAETEPTTEIPKTEPETTADPNAFKPVFVPLNFKDLDIEICGNKLHYKKNYLVKDLLKDTGLYIDYEHAGKSVEMLDNCDLLDDYDRTILTVYARADKKKKIENCTVDMFAQPGYRMDSLNVNGLCEGSNEGDDWKTILKQIGFKAGEPSQTKEIENKRWGKGTEYLYGSYDTRSAKISVKVYEKSQNYSITIEFPDYKGAVLYIWQWGDNQENSGILINTSPIF